MRTLALSLLVFVGLTPVQAFETLEFDDDTGLFMGTPDGYTAAFALFGSVQAEEGMSDGKGMQLTVGIGQGKVIYGPPMNVGSGKCLLELSVWCTGPGAALALAALDIPEDSGFEGINGSMSSNIEIDSGALAGAWHRFSLVYDPARDGFIPLFQAVSTGQETVAIFVDRMKVVNLAQAQAEGYDLAELLGLPATEPVGTPVPTEMPTDLTEATPTFTPTNTPTDLSNETPVETPTEVPTEQPTGLTEATPTFTPTEAPTEIPADTPTPTAVSFPDEAVEALNRVNMHRAAVGLVPMELHALLIQAAQAHSGYMAQNTDLDHYEDEGVPGFTGVTPWDRTTAAGYPPNTPIYEGVGYRTIGFADPTVNIDSQVEGPFHRVAPLHSGLTHFGYASVDGDANNYYTLNFGALSWDNLETVAYPGVDQEGVATQFDGHEWPDPFPDASYPVGYPVTLFVSRNQSFSVQAYSLKPVGGANLPMVVMEPGASREGYDTSYMFAMASASPLQGGVTYEASIAYTLEGVATTKTWQFTTDAAKGAPERGKHEIRVVLPER